MFTAPLCSDLHRFFGRNKDTMDKKQQKRGKGASAKSGAPNRAARQYYGPTGTPEYPYHTPELDEGIAKPKRFPALSRTLSILGSTLISLFLILIITCTTGMLYVGGFFGVDTSGCRIMRATLSGHSATPMRSSAFPGAASSRWS